MKYNKKQFFLVIGDNVILGECFANSFKHAVEYFNFHYQNYSLNQISEMVLSEHEAKTKLGKWSNELSIALQQVELA